MLLMVSLPTQRIRHPPSLHTRRVAQVARSASFHSAIAATRARYTGRGLADSIARRTDEAIFFEGMLWTTLLTSAEEICRCRHGEQEDLPTRYNLPSPTSPLTPAADVYSWSRLCPLKDVRVIIVGELCQVPTDARARSIPCKLTLLTH